MEKSQIAEMLKGLNKSQLAIIEKELLKAEQADLKAKASEAIMPLINKLFAGIEKAGLKKSLRKGVSPETVFTGLFGKAGTGTKSATAPDALLIDNKVCKKWSGLKAKFTGSPSSKAQTASWLKAQNIEHKIILQSAIGQEMTLADTGIMADLISKKYKLDRK